MMNIVIISTWRKERDLVHAPPLADRQTVARYRAEGWWRDRTLWDLALAAPADGVAVICPRNGAVTYRTLVVEAEQLAAHWHEKGLLPGDVVLLQLPNWYEFVLAHLALSRLGAVTVPTLPVYRSRELHFIAEASGARAIVGATGVAGCPDEDVYGRLLDLPALEYVWRAEDLRDFASGARTAHLPDPPSPDDVTIVMATSGTTGDPKLILHSHRSTVGGVIDEVATTMGLGPGDVLFMPSPISHATGLQYGVRMSILLGSTLLLQERWNPVAAAGLIHEHSACWVMGATPFLFDLVALPEVERAMLAPLRRFVCGGAPVPESLASQATDALPHVSLMTAWGMSETGIVTLVRPDAPLEKVVSSDGQAVRGWQIRIVDEQGRGVPSGTEGEIQCRGAALFHGYLGRDDLTDESVSGGWLRTGDVGRIDEDGYLRCLGRIKDLVIRGGVNLSATEIENVVRTHPDVDDVAVVGAPDPRLGERVCAFVVSSGVAPSVEDLGTYLLARGMAKVKLPERIVQVDELPTTATGKVQKHHLRIRLADSPDVS